MEKKTNVAKENHNREDKHFSGEWCRIHREAARARVPYKLPHSIVDKKQKDGRNEVSRLLKKQKIVFWTKYWTIGIGVSIGLSYLVAKWVGSVLLSP